MADKDNLVMVLLTSVAYKLQIVSDLVTQEENCKKMSKKLSFILEDNFTIPIFLSIHLITLTPK